MNNRGNNPKVNIIQSDKTVSETLRDLRVLFSAWGLEDWEPFSADDGTPTYSLRYRRGAVWSEISSRLQPTRAKNLRVCFDVVHRFKIWEERGVSGAASGVSFIGGLVPVGKSADRDSYEEACAVLGVDPGSTWEEAQKVYQTKVKFVHPDYGGDAERFKRLQKAYEYIEKVKGRG